MSLQTLPNELLFKIAENLSATKDLNAVVQTNSRLNILLTHSLYQHDVLNNSASASSWAARCDQSATLRKSIDAGADFSTATAHLKSDPQNDKTARVHPLVWAIEYRAVSCVRLLLEYGRVDPNFRDDVGYTPLMRAASSRQLNVVQLLLENGADVLFEFYTAHAGIKHPVPNAANMGDLVCLEILFTHMENLGRYTSDEIRDAAQSALREGGRKGDREVVRFAIGKGASVNDGVAGRMEPIRPVLEEILRSKGPHLLERSGRESFLYDVVGTGNESLVKLVLREGVDLRAFGGDALISAICKGFMGIVELLVEGGVNVNAVRQGWTALEYAIKTGDQGLIRILREHGAMEWKELRGQ